MKEDIRFQSSRTPLNHSPGGDPESAKLDELVHMVRGTVWVLLRSLMLLLSCRGVQVLAVGRAGGKFVMWERHRSKIRASPVSVPWLEAICPLGGSKGEKNKVSGVI